MGLLSVPWLMYSGLEAGQRGVLWDGDSAHPWLVLGHQVIGILAISGWSVAWSLVVFGALRLDEQCIAMYILSSNSVWSNL